MIDRMQFGQDEIQPDEDYPGLSSESAYLTAADAGWDVVLPKETELFIDIDDASGAATFDDLFAKFKNFVPNAIVVRRTPSPSGKPGHEHIVVDTSLMLCDTDRIMLQAILGSDRKRELFAWYRLEVDDKNPTLFFEKKEQSDEQNSREVTDEGIPF